MQHGGGGGDGSVVQVHHYQRTVSTYVPWAVRASSHPLSLVTTVLNPDSGLTTP